MDDDFFPGLFLHSFYIAFKKPRGLDAIDIKIQATREHPCYHQEQRDHRKIEEIKQEHE